jgi:hypothetical protein
MIRFPKSPLAAVIAVIIFTTSVVAQDTWSISVVNNSFNRIWNSVAYGDGVYVAVSGYGRIVASTDGGATFNEVANYQSEGVNFNDVEYGSNGTQNVFWATGNFGSTHFIYESPDGLNWTDIKSNFSFFAGQGGDEITVGASGELIYTRNAAGDAFLYDNTFYSFGLGSEPDIYTSTDGENYTVAVNDYSEWVTGGLVVGSQVLPYGVVFETPGDFSTRRGAIFDLTTDPLSASNPTIIATGDNTSITDMDMDPNTPTTLYATAADALLTSLDSGAT